MTALERAATRRNTEAVTTATHVRDEDGIVRTRGTKHLKQTQAYPMSFGSFHGRLFHDFFSPSVVWLWGLSPSMIQPPL
jgi:hypothetical protein